MELECLKYKEKMAAEDAECRHPADYCQYRYSCMIQFIAKENQKERQLAVPVTIENKQT